MREIIIISGKGGSGKTSLTGAFANLARDKIICDLDVDAPDLHLLLQPAWEREEQFFSGFEAKVDRTKCTACGLCATLCQFGAIQEMAQVLWLILCGVRAARSVWPSAPRRLSNFLRNTAANGTSPPPDSEHWSMRSSSRAQRILAGWSWS
jgi:ferredoxin